MDSYLNDLCSEQLLKDAFLVSKPFFFTNVVGERLQEASRVLMDAFKAESTSNLLLEYYVFTAWHPEAKGLMQRIADFSEGRERLKVLEAVMPELSRRYAAKRWISMMGEHKDYEGINRIEE